MVSDDSRPLTEPAVLTSRTARRTANGDTIPSSDTGTLKSSSVAKNEPATTPMLSALNPCSASWRNGWAMNGSTVIAALATSSSAAEDARAAG